MYVLKNFVIFQSWNYRLSPKCVVILKSPNGKNGTIDKEYWWFPIRAASSWSEIQIESRKAVTFLSHENCNKEGTVLKNGTKSSGGSWVKVDRRKEMWERER